MPIINPIITYDLISPLLNIKIAYINTIPVIMQNNTSCTEVIKSEFLKLLRIILNESNISPINEPFKAKIIKRYICLDSSVFK